MTEEELDDAEDEAENQMLAEYSAGGCLGLILILAAVVVKFSFHFLPAFIQNLWV
jgi:hypothetical protein